MDKRNGTNLVHWWLKSFLMVGTMFCAVQAQPITVSSTPVEGLRAILYQIGTDPTVPVSRRPLTYCFGNEATNQSLIFVPSGRFGW